MSTFAVVLAGLAVALCVSNLLLTLGVIRRLRRYGGPLPPPSGPPRGPRPMRPAGERIAAFHARTVRGEPISEEFFAGGTTLVGAFTEGCSACAERLPQFLRFAEVFPGGRERVLALLVGAAEDVAEERRLLEPVATVVVEESHGGPAGQALGVHGYPALAIVDPGGVVRASGTLLQDLATPAGV